MWRQVPQQLHNLDALRYFDPVDTDAHGHSPRGQGKDSNPTLTHADIARGLMMAQPPSGITGIKAEFEDSFLPAMASFPDPFVDDDTSEIARTLNGREGLEEQYVSDPSPSITPASRNQFDELVAALSARKDITGGLLAPTNTRASSAANTPRTQSRASIETEWRVFAHSHGAARSASMTSRDDPWKASQEPSDVEMDSGTSESWMDLMEQPGLSVQVSPTKEVKSRKEGMSRNPEHPLPKQKRSMAANLFRRNGKENRERSVENSSVVSDSKRKRIDSGSNSMLPIHQGGNGLSPMRKVIRTESEEEFSEDAGAKD